ncbi:MAG TPA: GatB/YqeY domain-containing protein [Afifellaceae bacterium]|nr:GatB/YqeY domain-containing protein [Afifellaceae bacterium]
MREKLEHALKESADARHKKRAATLRLINAAIRDRDREARAKGRDGGVSDDEIVGMLAQMIRQREESSAAYDAEGKPDMAEQERAEIEVIRSFLPQPMPEEEMKEACKAVVDEVGAHGLRDMGKCMGTLKQRYPGRMDFGKAGRVVKDFLK